jgi:hypothetical protein
MRAPQAFALSVLLIFSARLAEASGVIVVHNSKELQAAFGTVMDGGIIEAMPNVYPAPPKGFSIGNARKAFTVRARNPGTVFLDGKSTDTILRFKNGNRSNGKLVVFQKLTFRNGLSVTEGQSGGVTLAAAEARFERCSFLQNTATGKTTGGGAVLMNANSAVTFVNTNFRDNSSQNRGGAIETVGSSLTVQAGQFTNNHTNLPGHKRTSAGGAIYLLDGTARISDAHFEGNETGWTGGAVYAFGHWTDPVSTPKAEVVLVRSTFRTNHAVPDPCCGQAVPTSGGAVHVEDQTTLRVFGSQFFDNAADDGGALDSYRAVIEVHGSLFLGNRTPVVAGRLGVGGAISVASNDSAADGTTNRRPGQLTVTDSLLQGGVAPPATSAHTGGCIAVDGDSSRAYGVSIPALGTLAENRAPVALHRVTFADCDVQRGTAGGGLGGAISAVMVDLVMDSSLVFDSDARGTGAGVGGGGLALQRESTAVITGTTFAHDTAPASGGALYLAGSATQVTDCRFLRNEVSDQKHGAAIFAIPQLGGGFPGRDVGGLVKDSLFADNVGIPIWDVDPRTAPFNEMRYDDNQFYLGGLVYGNSTAAPNGVDVATLNNLKGNGNDPLFSRPSAGHVLASPGSLGTGAPPSAASFLAYAWIGGTANLAGQSLSSKAGLLSVGSAGTYPLVVDGTVVSSAELAVAPCTLANLCQ